MSQGEHSLRRSQDGSFFVTTNVKEHHSSHKLKRSQPLAFRPSMEIYRPPKVRTDTPSNVAAAMMMMANNKLNVHAKEFTMGHELQNSKSSGSLFGTAGVTRSKSKTLQPMLQHSRSSGNILRPVTGVHNVLPLISLPLLHSNSGQMLNMPVNHLYGPVYPSVQVNQHWTATPATFAALKRSKSLGSTESKSHSSGKLTNIKEELDLSIFPAEVQVKMRQTVEEPSRLSTRATMDLVKLIMEQVVNGRKYCESCAKLSVSIIDRSSSQTFLESLLNTCQQWYQKRENILLGIQIADGTRFTAFMWFLTEMYAQLKRHQVTDGELQPDLVVLNLLAKCCQTCVMLPIKCLLETECLFFVLTSIGRDLESELPQELEKLMDDVRDGFLASAGNPSVRKTLLQLIELHASNWQLPGSSVLYYYPRIK